MSRQFNACVLTTFISFNNFQKQVLNTITCKYIDVFQKSGEPLFFLGNPVKEDWKNKLTSYG